eukprot:Em0017g945a
MAVEIELNSDRFVQLLGKLIGEAKYLQNNPPKFIPQEDRAIQHVKEVLEPFSTAKGGPIQIDHVTFVEGRGNLILTYNPSGSKRTVAFVGSHLDVVPANPETWNHDPFSLTVEGDKLYGRGTTDCLGHVALITDLFAQLAEKKVSLNFSLVAVFIASEENTSIPGVGVEKLVELGKLDHLRDGPVYWVDSADSSPCMGTASAAMWTLRAEGRLFHSGLPHKGINSQEFVNEAVAYLQKRFYEDFPPHPKETEYKFATPSTMKPTLIKCSEGSVNQIPPWTEVQGDIRLTPFYNIDECVKKVEGYVKKINDDPTILPTRGPCSKYVITAEGVEYRAKLEFKLNGSPLRGIACNLESTGYKHLEAASSEVLGAASQPYSLTGSLPLVGDLQAAGFDIQVCGYGHTSVYHGNNEYCSLSCMKNAMKIFSLLLNKHNA